MNTCRRVLLAGLGAGLLALAFAGDDWGLFAWIALVPWLIALRGLPPGPAFMLGWVGGWAATVLTFGWLSAVPAFGTVQFVVLGGYVALYPAGWCAGVSMLQRRGRSLPLFAPVLWVALDGLRHHAGFLALPIATLAQSQQAFPRVLQPAALGGEAMVTGLVVLGNVALASLIGRRLGRGEKAAFATVAVALAAGSIALGGDEPPARVTLAAVQPNIGLQERGTEAGRDAVWQRLRRLSHEAVAQGAALVVWPETAVGHPRHDAHLERRLSELSRDLHTPLVIGSSETEKFAVASAEGTQVQARDAYNAADLILPGEPPGVPYRKRRLMPFGEYLPLADDIAWPAWLAPPVAPGRSGDREAGFEAASLRLGVVICWENLFADLSRGAVHGGAALLVQLTNDAWFAPGRAATQHNAASVLRAVENRVPLVLSSNAGPSLVIDAHGRIVARTTRQFDTGIAVASVAVGHGLTPFTRYGDWFTVACLALLAGAPFPARSHIRFLVPSNAKERP